MPVTWVLALLLWATWAKNPTHKKRLLGTTLTLLLCFTNPFLVNELLLWWEVPPTRLAEVGYHEVGVVLTGVTQTNKIPKDRTYFNKGGDRLTHTVMLYRLGKIKKILISGATDFDRLGRVNTHESDMRRAFLDCGVPDSAVFLESQSKNTYENAFFTAQMLKAKNKTIVNWSGKEVLLITSGFHLPRAMACFEKQEVTFEPFSVDFYSNERVFEFKSFMPSEEAFWKLSVFCRELVGFVIYKCMGYS